MCSEKDLLKIWDEELKKLSKSHKRALNLFDKLDSESKSVIVEMLKGKEIRVKLNYGTEEEAT